MAGGWGLQQVHTRAYPSQSLPALHSSLLTSLLAPRLAGLFALALVRLLPDANLMSSSKPRPASTVRHCNEQAGSRERQEALPA